MPTCKNCGGKHYTYQCWSKPKRKTRPVKPFRAVLRPSKPKSSNSERQRLIRELDKYVSLYVRRKDADKNGLVYCYTCGVRGHWKSMDCGHYIKRRYLHTRWDLLNVRKQCQFCNRTLGGNYGVYEKKIREELGTDNVQKLWDKAYKTDKIPTVMLEVMLEEIKTKVKNLEKTY